MRILYLHQYFNTPAMTGGTRSYEMARRWVRAGHEVTMLTSWRDGDSSGDWFETIEDGINVHWLPVAYSNALSYQGRISAFSRFALSSAKKAASLRTDVVFATSTPLTICLPGVYASRRLGVPMVFEVRDLWPELPIALGALENPVLRYAARKLESFAYRNADQIVALSPGMASGVVRSGVAQDKVHIVPNSADLDMFSRDSNQRRRWRMELGLDEDQVLVAYTGTLGRLNGVGYLVRLASRLKDELRIRFLIVGDGHEREEILDLARRLRVLNHNLTILPPMAKSDICGLMSGVDVATSLFLPLPEMEANSANKFFDALAAGCAVAINYGGWQKELLDCSGAGISLPADPHLGAVELKDFVSDKRRLEACGISARSLAEREFSRDFLATKLQKVLELAISAESD